MTRDAQLEAQARAVMRAMRLALIRVGNALDDDSGEAVLHAVSWLISAGCAVDAPSFRAFVNAVLDETEAAYADREAEVVACADRADAAGEAWKRVAGAMDDAADARAAGRIV